MEIDVGTSSKKVLISVSATGISLYLVEDCYAGWEIIMSSKRRHVGIHGHGVATLIGQAFL